MRVLRALVEDGLHADGVGVLERATTERREADSHDQTHVGFSRRLDGAVVKAARRLDAHRQPVPNTDLFTAPTHLALLDRISQFGDRRTGSLLPLSLGPGLVILENNSLL